MADIRRADFIFRVKAVFYQPMRACLLVRQLSEEFVVAADYQGRVRVVQTVEYLQFCRENILASFEVFDVTPADIRYHRAVWVRGLRQRGNLAPIAHSHFYHRRAVIGVQAEQRSRKSDIVVEISLGFKSVELRRQNGVYHILCRRFPHRTRNSAQLYRELVTIIPRELKLRRSRIVNAYDRDIGANVRIIANRSRSAVLRRLLYIIVSVKAFALYRDKQRVLIYRSRIRGNGSRRDVRADKLAACNLRYLFSREHSLTPFC